MEPGLPQEEDLPQEVVDENEVASMVLYGATLAPDSLTPEENEGLSQWITERSKETEDRWHEHSWCSEGGARFCQQPDQPMSFEHILAPPPGSTILKRGGICHATIPTSSTQVLARAWATSHATIKHKELEKIPKLAAQLMPNKSACFRHGSCLCRDDDGKDVQARAALVAAKLVEFFKKGSPLRLKYEKGRIVLRFQARVEGSAWYWLGIGNLTTRDFTGFPMLEDASDWIFDDDWLLLRAMDPLVPKSLWAFFEIAAFAPITRTAATTFTLYELVWTETEMALGSFVPGRRLRVTRCLGIEPVGVNPSHQKALPVTYDRRMLGAGQEDGVGDGSEGRPHEEGRDGDPGLTPLLRIVNAVLRRHPEQRADDEIGWELSSASGDEDPWELSAASGGEEDPWSLEEAEHRLRAAGAAGAAAGSAPAAAPHVPIAPGGDEAAGHPRRARRDRFPRIWHSSGPAGDGFLRLSHSVGQEWHDMRAECPQHPNCTLSRTCRGGMRAGAGRPIGHLWAWLESAHGCVDKDQHKRVKPSYEQRCNARIAFQALPGAEAWVAAEYGGEGIEPEELV